MIRLFLALVVGCSAPTDPIPSSSALPAPEGVLPSESIYQLSVEGSDARGQATALALHRGHPTVVTMFYASCPQACPMLIRDAQALDESLEPGARAQVRYVLVSLDPDRDSAEALAKVVALYGLDERWTLVRVPSSDVRSVAAVLGVRYRPTSDGGMNHSSILTLVDREGVVVAQSEGLGVDRTALVAAIHRVASKP
jgi:protein SCO1/2